MKFKVRHGVRYCGYAEATLNDCNKAIAKKRLEKEGTMALNEAVEIANAVFLIEAGSNGATASASASGVSHSEGPIKGTLARVTTVGSDNVATMCHGIYESAFQQLATVTLNWRWEAGKWLIQNAALTF